MQNRPEDSMKKVITGNHAVSFGAQCSRVQVISAYPITPQTQIVELLSEFCASGKLAAKFIKVESEHSAMAACVAASAAGTRAFTATSAQGLALMHEVLHWAAGARLPIVLADVNRAMGPGWSVWTDQSDSLSQRDTGWLQFYCESNQEVVDTCLISYRVAEQIMMPVMFVLDAFVLSHTSEGVDIPEMELCDQYLPPYKPELKLDLADPRSFGALSNPDHYYEIRYKMQKAHEQALPVVKQAHEEFARIFGRSYGMTESYRCEDAELVLVTTGTITGTARVVIDSERAKGRRVGLLKIRLFRPTPVAELKAALLKVPKVAIIDRNISFGHGGIWTQEIKSALYDEPVRPTIFSYIIGIGGRDVTPKDIQEIVDFTLASERPPAPIIWRGVRL
jgi:pyruvate/2-oxoacid:ferredoxin oxidoreductase alpha subunit